MSAGFSVDKLLEIHPFNGCKEYKLYKFVRLSGNNYVFCHSDPYGPYHKDLVKIGDNPETAGVIAVSNDSWYVVSAGSMSLNIGMDSHDENNLSVLLGRKCRGR